MSFELFIWLDEAWSTTGRRFKTRESAGAAGKSLGITGLTTMHSLDFDVRESSEEPNE
jgi:hypothetical protein